MNDMKICGIVSGLGPETSAAFTLKVIQNSLKIYSEVRPPIINWNVPLNIKHEADFIKLNKYHDYYLDKLIESCVKLEKSGADFIAIPCNSVHIFISELKKTVSIPIINIVEEATFALLEESEKNVVVLGTEVTLRSNLYQDALSKSGIKAIVPSKNNAQILSNLITLVVGIIEDQNQIADISKILKELKQEGAESVLLACTDLHLIKPLFSSWKIYDSFDILAESVAKYIHGKPFISKRSDLVECLRIQACPHLPLSG